MKYHLVGITLFIFGAYLHANSLDTLKLNFLKGDYEAVIKTCSKNWNLSADEALIYFYALKQLNKSDELIEITGIYSQKMPDNPLILKYTAAILLEYGRLNESLQYYEKLLLNDPENTAYLVPKFNILKIKEDFSNAIHVMKKAISVDSTNVTFYTKLSDVYVSINEMRLAEQAMRRAYQLDKDNELIKRELVKLNFEINNYGLIHNLCHTEILKDGSNRFYYRYNGSAFYREGNFISARENLQFAYNNGSRNKYLIKYLGISYFKSGDHYKAAKYLKEYIKEYDHAADVDYYLGSSLSYLEDHITALPYLQKALDLMTPEKKVIAEIYLQKGMSNRALKFYDYAKADFLTAIKTDSAQAVLAYFYLGSMHEFDLKLKNEALNYYTEFLEQNSIKDAEPSQNMASYKSAAEQRIMALKEELFFNKNITE